MNTKAMPALACALFLGWSAGALEAQQAQRVFAGPHVSYGFEDYSEAGVGIHGTYPLTDLFLGAVSFTYFFPDEDIDFWDVNVNGHYLIQIEGNVTPYLGAGINYSRISFDVPDVPFLDSVSNSEFGFNLLGGAILGLGNAARLFAEGRYVVSDLDQFIVTIGLSFPIMTLN
jgi:opacity protein-like surface antigen